MKRPLLASVLALGGVLLFSPPALAASSFSTLGAWDGSSSVSSFGYPNTATYGQVVTVPGGETTLSSFLFELRIPASTTFRAEVYAWNGAEATGPSLYESGDRNTSGTSSFQQVVVSTGGIPVVPGNQYVLFLSTSKSVGSGQGSWGMPAGNPDTTGEFVYQNNGTNPGAWTTTPWNTFGGEDLAYSVGYGGVIVGNGSAPTAGACWNALGTDGCSQLGRAAVCSPDGGFQNILVSQLAELPFSGFSPAAYVEGYGLVCSLTDIASYGGDPSAYVDAGYKVDETGLRAPEGYTDASWNALYEFFAKKA